MARKDSITVMLESTIKERFVFYAESMGLTTSELGAYVIGNWVYQQERTSGTYGPIAEEMKRGMTAAVNKQMQDDQTGAVITGKAIKDLTDDELYDILESGKNLDTRDLTEDEIIDLERRILRIQMYKEKDIEK